MKNDFILDRTVDSESKASTHDKTRIGEIQTSST